MPKNSKRKILIVDDSRTQRFFLEQILLKENFKVFSAENGETAEILIAQEDIHVIILDWELPEITGPELVKIWLNKFPGRFIPIILLTSHKSPDYIKEGLESGAIDFIAKPANEMELFARLNSALRIRDLQHNLHLMSILDPLTELYNRRYLNDKFSIEIEACRRYKRSISCAMIDIDFFKKVNDTYGHQVGDLVLKQMAKLLQEHFRRTDLVARFGGEEFVIIFRETDQENALLCLNRLLEKTRNVKFGEDLNPFNLSFSAGLVSLKDVTIEKHEDVLRAADEALYKAKKQGRNQIVVADLCPEKKSA